MMIQMEMRDTSGFWIILEEPGFKQAIVDLLEKIMLNQDISIMKSWMPLSHQNLLIPGFLMKKLVYGKHQVHTQKTAVCITGMKKLLPGYQQNKK